MWVTVSSSAISSQCVSLSLAFVSRRFRLTLFDAISPRWVEKRVGQKISALMFFLAEREKHKIVKSDECQIVR
jgi:hypothetical protein